jgi:hypothetical protein
VRYLVLILGAAGALLTACGTDPTTAPEELLQGSYGAQYDPPLAAGATTNCDRSIPHAVLGVNDLGDFDLSVNTIDDCTRAGGGFEFSEVLHLGSYTRQGALLSFTPDSASAPLFTGTLEGNSSD